MDLWQGGSESNSLHSVSFPTHLNPENHLYPWEISHAITLHHSPSHSALTRLRIRGLGVQVPPGAPLHTLKPQDGIIEVSVAYN